MTLGLTMESDFKPFDISFTMPVPGQEQLYGMPTSMLAGLNMNASTFAENATTAYSSLLASGLAIGNPGRTIQPQLGM